MSGASRRVTRILSEVRQDLDAFLDSNVLSLVDHESRHLLPPSVTQAAVEPLKQEDEGLPDQSGSSGSPLELFALREKIDGLRSELEAARREAETLRAEHQRRASDAAAHAARLKEECGRLKSEGWAQRRQTEEVQNKLDAAQLDKEELNRQGEDLARVLRDELRTAKAEAEAERKQLQEKVARLEESGASSSSTMPGGGEAAVAALRGRVADLEGEAASLRLALEQSAPDRALSQQLRTRFSECELELQEAREVKRQLQEIRAQALMLEQEKTALEKALEARDSRLQQVEEAARSDALAQRDLAAFAKAAATIVAEAADAGTAADAHLSEGQAAKAPGVTGAIKPIDLAFAWASVQREIAQLRKQRTELQQCLDKSSSQERQKEQELASLRADLAQAQTRVEEQSQEIKRLEGARATMEARVAVLREAISRTVGGLEEPAKQGETSAALEALRDQLQATQQQVGELEGLLSTKDAALRQASEDKRAALEETLRQKSLAADAVEKGAQLTRANADLWNANRDMELHQERLSAELRRSQGAAPAIQVSAAISTTADAGGDRHLDAFKKATRKAVQDFREGIFALLGWKVEMRDDGRELIWQLTSRYQDGKGLMFALRPAASGRSVEFDLLHSPWAEQLQEDQHAMAYLKHYRSVPGFLAHVTQDLLSQQVPQS